MAVRGVRHHHLDIISMDIGMSVCVSVGISMDVSVGMSMSTPVSILVSIGTRMGSITIAAVYYTMDSACSTRILCVIICMIAHYLCHTSTRRRFDLPLKD